MLPVCHETRETFDLVLLFAGRGRGSFCLSRPAIPTRKGSDMETTSAFRDTLAMTCPVCHVALQPTTRQAIEIDFCPQCRGVWLDRGELDKILEREAGMLTPGRDSRDYDRPAGHRPSGQYRRDDDDDHREGYGGRRKRRGLLGELLDFD